MEWFDALVQGVLLGGMYAQYALGMALMFGVMRIVNISHGDLVILLVPDRHFAWPPPGEWGRSRYWSCSCRSRC